MKDKRKSSRPQKHQIDPLRYFESMDKINHAMQGKYDLDEVMKDVLDALLSVFECDRAWLVYPCDPDAATWQTPMERTRPEFPGVLPIGVELPLDPVGAAVYRILRNADGPVQFGPKTQYPVPTEIAGAFQVQSFIAMAFYPKVGKPWSFGLHQCSYARFWTAEEELIFKEAGRRLSDTLTSLLMYRDLQESEEKYRTLIQKIHAAVVVHGADTQILTSNSMAQELLGLTEDQMLGKTSIDPAWSFLLEDGTAMPPEEYPVNVVLGSHKPLRNFIAGVHRPDNKNDVWVLVNADPVFDKERQITQVIVTFIDITERRQAEEALRKSEQRYHGLFEDSSISIWEEDFSLVKERLDLLRQEGVKDFAAYFNDHPELMTEYASQIKVVDINKATLKMFEARTKSELLENVAQVIKNDDFGIFREELVKIANGELDFQWEEPNQTLAGNQIYILFRWSVVPGFEDTLSRVIISIIDITQRKQAEEALRASENRFRVLSETAFVGIYIIQDGRISYVNSTEAKIFGYTPEELIGADPRLLVHPDDQAMVLENIRRRIDGEIETIHYEFRGRCKDGSIKNIEVLGGRVDFGGKIAVIGNLMDITNRKRAEEEIRHLNQDLEQQLRHLTTLHQIDIAITTNFDSEITLNIILNHVKDELKVNAADILLLNPVTHTLDYAAGVGFRTHNIESSHVKLGNEFAGRAAQEYRTISCADLRQAGDTFGRSLLLGDEEFIVHFATPLMVKGQVKGVLELFHRKTFEPDAEWINYFETLATQAAIAIESASLVENLQQSNMELTMAYDATIEGWSRALDLRDRETEGHTQRVTDMALALAEKMGFNEAEKMNLRRGALLHDIGKMGVPDSILLKPGPLSEEETEIMHQHPTYAYQMLSPITYLKNALDICYCHHEKWDGSGYPRGLKGEEIPLSARLFAVVDVFDALTTDRPYRSAWVREEVYQYIEEQAGKHFDPKIAKIFLEDRI